MSKNMCQGCIYDLTRETATSKEILDTILDKCCSCKRGVREEFKNDYQDSYTTSAVKLVDKIANFFEQEENWAGLKNCWLENGRSNDLRNLLHKAINE